MNNPYAQHAFKLKSRDEVVVEFAPLVKRIANRLAARMPANMDVNDLIQAGMIGLLDAIEKYDPGREAQFRTYAEFRIRGAMLDDLRAGDWVPRSVRERADQVARANVGLRAELGRQPDEEEIAERMGLTLDEYHILLFKSRVIPLLKIEDLHGHRDDEDHGNIFDILEDPSIGNPLDALSLRNIHEKLQAAITELPERERLVLSLYYDEELNLKEIGQVLGITESRVSQIRTQAILRLRAAVQTHTSHDLLTHALEHRAI